MQGNTDANRVSTLSDEEADVLSVDRRMREIAALDLGLGSRKTRTASNAALYHLQSGGNRTRARLCILACLKLGVFREDAINLGACVELLHNASLIHDDLQDHERERHGVESVWCKFSPAIAICAGDLLISSAYSVLASFSKPHLIPTLISAVHRCVALAIHGQCEDLESSNPFELPLETYSSIVKAKSGALLSLPLELALIASENFLSLNTAKKAAEDFSVGYQISDDLQDIEQDSASNGKPASLNVYLIMQRHSNEAMAKETVRSLGRSYFNSAFELAGTLPHQSGQYLQKLAHEMVTFL